MSATTTSKSTESLTLSLLSEDQELAIDRLYEADSTLLIGKMGAGKTVCTLAGINALLKDKILNRVLIIAPKKVCDTVWRTEHKKWAELAHLRVSICVGTAPQRKKILEQDSDIVVINFESAVWLLENYPELGCDGLLIDEMSKLKDTGGKLFKRVKSCLRRFKWRAGLTGTPVSEDFIGLYGMARLLDGGASLGTRKDEYLWEYFFPTDYEQRNWVLRPNCGGRIAEKVKDLCYVMPDYRDALPPIEYWDELIDLPAETRRIYATLKKDMIVEVDSGDAVAVNSAVLGGKLMQAASGFLYDEEKVTNLLHEEKFKRLDQIIKDSDTPVLVAYWFEADKQRLIERYGCPVEATQDAVAQWNAGKLSVLGLHPRSAGHGLNLARGGATVVWLTPYWSRDLWEQFNARLWRTGQTLPVTVHVILARGTIDEVVMERIDGKGEFDKLLLAHLRAA